VNPKQRTDKLITAASAPCLAGGMAELLDAHADGRIHRVGRRVAEATQRWQSGKK